MPLAAKSSTTAYSAAAAEATRTSRPKLATAGVLATVGMPAIVLISFLKRIKSSVKENLEI
jgi:hypothetical protein